MDYCSNKCISIFLFKSLHLFSPRSILQSWREEKVITVVIVLFQWFDDGSNLDFGRTSTT